MSIAKVLLIDDEQELLDLLRLSLEMEDFDVITAQNGEEGIAQFHAHAPDVVVCDIIMPKKDGYEVLREVKHAAKRWVPFIMLSAVGESSKIKQAYEQETDFYLTKPVDPWVIAKNIRTLLNLAKQRAAYSQDLS